jgi:hypothetical protein
MPFSYTPAPDEIGPRFHMLKAETPAQQREHAPAPPRCCIMAKVVYRIVPAGEGWNIETDGKLGTVAFVSKEAAFEALVAAADVELAAGSEIEIRIPGGAGRFA